MEIWLWGLWQIFQVHSGRAIAIIQVLPLFNCNLIWKSASCSFFLLFFYHFFFFSLLKRNVNIPLQIPAVVLGRLLADRSGRRPLLMVRMRRNLFLSSWLIDQQVCNYFINYAGFCWWNVLEVLDCRIVILITGLF